MTMNLTREELAYAVEALNLEDYVNTLISEFANDTYFVFENVLSINYQEILGNATEWN
jgi:hypothetical protein